MTNHDLIHQQARTIARQQQRIAELTGGTMQPSDLDMPPLEARPSLAERVATLEAKVASLEAKVASLEAALAEKLTVKVYTETPDYLKPPFKVT